MKTPLYMVVIALLSTGTALLGSNSQQAHPPYAIPVKPQPVSIPYARPVNQTALPALPSTKLQKSQQPEPSYGLFTKISDLFNGTAVNVHEELLEGTFNGNEERVKKTIEESIRQNDVDGLFSLVNNLIQQKIKFDRTAVLNAVEELEKKNTQAIQNLALKIQKRPLILLTDAQEADLIYMINAYHTNDIQRICNFHEACFNIKQKIGFIPATETYVCDRKAIIHAALNQLPGGSIPAHVISLDQ